MRTLDGDDSPRHLFGAIIDRQLMRMTRARAVRVAIALWIAWAIVAWNVVLDQTLVIAGRRYIIAAVGAAQGPGPYARIDDWMRPVLVRGFCAATLTAIAIVAIGLGSVRAAARGGQPS